MGRSPENSESRFSQFLYAPDKGASQGGADDEDTAEVATAPEEEWRPEDIKIAGIHGYLLKRGIWVSQYIGQFSHDDTVEAARQFIEVGKEHTRRFPKIPLMVVFSYKPDKGSGAKPNMESFGLLKESAENMNGGFFIITEATQFINYIANIASQIPGSKDVLGFTYAKNHEEAVKIAEDFIQANIKMNS